MTSRITTKISVHNSSSIFLSMRANRKLIIPC